MPKALLGSLSFRESNDFHCWIKKTKNSSNFNLSKNTTTHITMFNSYTKSHRNELRSTHVKISPFAARLPTSRYQAVFAKLVTICQQVAVNSCNNFVGTIRPVASLFQQGRYNHDTTIWLQPCFVNLVTTLVTCICKQPLTMTNQMFCFMFIYMTF